MLEPVSIKKGADVELNIESLAFGGMGVAHFNNMVTFVKNAIPGQKVTARITKKRSSYLEAQSLEVWTGQVLPRSPRPQLRLQPPYLLMQKRSLYVQSPDEILRLHS